MTWLGDDTKIAGKHTVKQWLELKEGLCDGSRSWEEAYDLFYKKRLETRYLKPIRKIQEIGDNYGEGFSIVSIQCALIEFLQATYDGMNFEKKAGWYKENLESKKYKYAKGTKYIFVKFLTEQGIYDDEVDAEDFYSSIRCGLLHEAATTGTWKIRKSPSGKGAHSCKVLYRDQFQTKLEKYIVDYREKLLDDCKRQKAFKRKFDALCKE